LKIEPTPIKIEFPDLDIGPLEPLDLGELPELPEISLEPLKIELPDPLADAPGKPRKGGKRGIMTAPLK
jgi:hypothetical protein